MKQIKDLPKDWALYLGDKSMPKWKEALDCYNKLTERDYSGYSKFYMEESSLSYLNSYKKILTPEEFVSHFEIEHTIEDELAAMRYKVGDIIVTDSGDERRVLGVCGLVYFISQSNAPNTVSPTSFTQKELDDFNFKKKL